MMRTSPQLRKGLDVRFPVGIVLEEEQGSVLVEEETVKGEEAVALPVS